MGPAIASGNQVYKGNCADLPVAPNQTNSTVIPVRLLYPTSEYAANPDNVPTQSSGDAFTSKVFWQN